MTIHSGPGWRVSRPTRGTHVSSVGAPPDGLLLAIAGEAARERPAETITADTREGPAIYDPDVRALIPL